MKTRSLTTPQGPFRLMYRMRAWAITFVLFVLGSTGLRAESFISEDIPGLREESRQLLEKILAEHQKATGERIHIRRSETEKSIEEPDRNEAAGAWTLWIHPKKSTLTLQADVSGASILSDDSKHQIEKELFATTLRSRGIDAAIRLSVQGLLERLRSPLAASGRLVALALIQAGEAPSEGIEPLQIPLPLSLAALALSWVALFFLGRILFSTEIQVSVAGVQSIPPLALFFQEMRAVAQERKSGGDFTPGGVDGNA